MRNIANTLIVVLLLTLISCATKPIASRQEARYRLNEQARVGLITKEQCAIEIRKVAELPLPELPSEPFNRVAIQREYDKKARENLVAPITKQYNFGVISHAEYQQRLQAMLHILMASNQYSDLSNYPTIGFAPSFSANRFDPNSLSNPYGAGSPYKSDGLMNPYSQYGSPYSNNSWTNPYATNAPKLYDANGKYLGKLSNNKYDPDSTSNPYGRYGSQYSSDSINNPYGAGNPYSTSPIYVTPQQ